MKELTFIIDEATGALTIEGLSLSEWEAQPENELLTSPRRVDCARPVNIPPLKGATKQQRAGEPHFLRVHRVYHGSVVEGFGRRSVLQTQGCNLACASCNSRQTHSFSGGVLLSIAEAVELLLDPTGEPRDGVTVLGGEPFLQPAGLAALLLELKKRKVHITLYSGFTIEELRARCERSVHEALALTDVLIDGRFVAALSKGAGEWRGSSNQRVIHNPANYLPEGS